MIRMLRTLVGGLLIATIISVPLYFTMLDHSGTVVASAALWSPDHAGGGPLADFYARRYPHGSDNTRARLRWVQSESFKARAGVPLQIRIRQDRIDDVGLEDINPNMNTPFMETFVLRLPDRQEVLHDAKTRPQNIFRKLSLGALFSGNNENPIYIYNVGSFTPAEDGSYIIVSGMTAKAFNFSSNIALTVEALSGFQTMDPRLPYAFAGIVVLCTVFLLLTRPALGTLHGGRR